MRWEGYHSDRVCGRLWTKCSRQCHEFCWYLLPWLIYVEEFMNTDDFVETLVNSGHVPCRYIDLSHVVLTASYLFSHCQKAIYYPPIYQYFINVTTFSPFHHLQYEPDESAVNTLLANSCNYWSSPMSHLEPYLLIHMNLPSISGLLNSF